MLICLIREIDEGAAEDRQHARGTLLKTNAMTIGSAPDQYLQIFHRDVNAHHAVLRLGPGGRLLLTALSSKGVMVNGRRETKTFLKSNDTLQFGDTTVKVQTSYGEYTCVLRVKEPYAGDEPAPAGSAHSGTHGSRFTISFWSWTLTIGVAAIFLLVPLGTFVAPSFRKLLRTMPLVPSDALWSAGPLHAAHRFIGNDCTACHVNPFERVRNLECEKCHADVHNHVDVRTADAALFDGERCAECHFEHKEPATLVLRDQRLCTDCHARLDKLKPGVRIANVADFGSAHPDFRIAVLTQDATPPGRWRPQWLDAADPAAFREDSHLKFSHAQHLDPRGIKSPTGERVLDCADCHRPNSSGRAMLPIRMESQCSGCHSLHFDERDPASGVPHGDLQKVFRSLREHFSRQYLEAGGAALRGSAGDGLRRPGAEGHAMSLDEQRRARDWAEVQSLKVARELLEKRVCVDCHEVTRVPGTSGFDQWRLAPVRLTEIWMPRAHFNHATHITEACTSCHTDAERSEHSTDILMPGIAQCRGCHGDANDNTKLSSDCVMCHRFHMPNRGRFDTKAAASVLALQ